MATTEASTAAPTAGAAPPSTPAESDGPAPPCQSGADQHAQPAPQPPAPPAYRLKHVTMRGRRVPVVMQNENGPCPLLAIANVLLLRNQIQLPAGASDVLQVRAQLSARTWSTSRAHLVALPTLHKTAHCSSQTAVGSASHAVKQKGTPDKHCFCCIESQPSCGNND